LRLGETTKLARADLDIKFVAGVTHFFGGDLEFSGYLKGSGAGNLPSESDALILFSSSTLIFGSLRFELA